MQIMSLNNTTKNGDLLLPDTIYCVDSKNIKRYISGVLFIYLKRAS